MTSEEISEVRHFRLSAMSLSLILPFGAGSSTPPFRLTHLSHPSVLSKVRLDDRGRPADMGWARLGRQRGREEGLLWHGRRHAHDYRGAEEGGELCIGYMRESRAVEGILL
jgi:hypothetical protein